MKLKGRYSGVTNYNVEDVVLFTDDHVYHLQHPCPAGVPPVNTLYWSRASQTIEDIVKLCIDAMDALNARIDLLNIPTNISEDAIMLRSTTPESEKEFLITVDDEGELSVDEISDGGGEDNTPAEGGETPAEGGETPAEGGKGGEG